MIVRPPRTKRAGVSGIDGSGVGFGPGVGIVVVGATGIGADGVGSAEGTVMGVGIFAILGAQAESTAVAPALANNIRNSRRDIPEAQAFFHNALVSSSFGRLEFILPPQRPIIDALFYHVT